MMMTKQQRYQARNRAKGVCITCSRPLGLFKWHCNTCHAVQKDGQRRRLGSKPWREGGLGRKPYNAEASTPNHS